MTENELLECFREFIRIPSVTGSAGEEKACEFLEAILDEKKIPHERVSKVPSRPNLIAVLKADHPTEKPMMLISHIDVVDGIPEKWSAPVFGAEIRDGRIYGRGTLDTKHLTIMELYSFLKLADMTDKLNRDVYFIATIDEEGGSNFGMGYVKEARPELFGPSVVINEGGGFPLHINGKNYMMMTAGEKAVCKVHLRAEGLGGHASAPHSDQAMQKFAAALERLYTADITLGSHATYQAMSSIVGSEDWDNKVAASIHGYAAQNSIGIRGYKFGTASNVIPAVVETDLEFKVLPETTPDMVEAFVKETLQGLPVTAEVISYEKGFEQREDNSSFPEMAKALQKAMDRHGFEGTVLPMLALGRTDGRFFGSEGADVYGCSPLLMEDSFDVVLPKVHGNDESIKIDSFFFGTRVLKDLIFEMCLEEEA